MPELDGVVITAIIFFAVAFTGLTALSGVSDTTEYSDGILRTQQTEPLDGTAQYTEIDDGTGQSETVYNSLGFAANLSGDADSYVQSQDNINFATDDTWTVSVWGKLHPSAPVQTRTLLSLNGRVVISYYPMQGNWSAWYYNESSTNSYRVNVSAVNVHDDLQNVMVWSNGSHLAIYQNNTLGDVKDITGESITDAPASTSNWNGSIDEIRTFDDALNNSQRSSVVSSPVSPQPNTNRTARIMFDEASKSTQSIFFTSGRLDQSNVVFTDGHTGKAMDGQSLINDITAQTDYVWDEDGPRIYIVEGGELDGAPVVYIDYTFYSLGGAEREFSDALTRAFNTAAIVPVVMLLVTLIGYLTLLRGQ